MEKFILSLIICLIAKIGYASEITPVADYPRDTTEKKSKKKHYGTDHIFNLDLGTNNYHNNGNFPDENNETYSVRPWGSWYVGLTSLQRSHISGGLFAEWGGGVSWYNFKFQNDNTRLTEAQEGLIFYEDTESGFRYQKSKLTVSYANLYLVPVYQFGRNKYKPDGKSWNGKCNYENLGFRIGLGGYLGYRLGSHTKIKYEDDGKNTRKAKEHDNFYLQNLRYGLRLQAGYKGTDIFINYDINDLFNKEKGPELSAVSFGFMF